MASLNFLRAKQNQEYRYKLTVFMICLAISAFIWILIKLSDQYSSDIVIPVTYADIPEGKILVNKVDTAIKIGITERGFALAWVKYFREKKPINISLKNYRLREQMHQYVSLIGTQAWSQQFLNQYDLKGEVDYILPDTIAFYFEDRYSREVPVKSDIQIKFRKQFFAYDTMTIDPAKVTISGLYKHVNKISAIKTVHISFENLNQSIDQKVKLQLPQQAPDIQIKPPEVNITLPVEKFTELQIEIPITKVNEPEGERIKIFPDNVTVKYLIALKDYDKINPDMFSCQVNLSKINTVEDNKLEVSVNSHPQFIKIISTEPAEVDYLVLK
jgi:hypothetical protein